MKSTETAREFRRRCGVGLIDRGVSVSTIADVFGVSPSSLRRWHTLAKPRSVNRYTRLSTPRVRRTKNGSIGRPRKLTDQQLRDLEQLLSQGATAHGWMNDLWTTKRIAEVIRRHFHISCRPNQAWTIVTKYLGWTAQRPVQQLRSPDDAEIVRWLEQDYPIVLERAHRRNAHLVFIDESGFMFAPVIRRSYAPRGHPPVLKVSNPHGKISVIGAMNISPQRRHFGFCFDLLANNVNFCGTTVVPFLERIHRALRGPVTLLWDAIPIHRADPVQQYLHRHRTTVVEPFPRYAPDLNPVDKIWFYVKFDRLPNYAPPDLTDLRLHIKREFRRLQKRSALLESLFRLTKLTRDW